MKNIIAIFTVAMLLLAGTGTANAQRNNKSNINNKNTTTMTTENTKMTAILEAVELYAEAGRKASRTLGQQAFTESATMSWVENGKINTVPINALFDVLEQTGAEVVTYTVEDVTIAGNIAFVRISSSFSKLASFNDMFTLAEQDGKWKIVSKIYSVKQ